MTDDAHAGTFDSPVTTDVLPLPLDFEALYVSSQEAYHRFALAVLDDHELAEEAVHRAFLEILRHWEALLADSNVPQHCWAILRRTVMSRKLTDYRDSLADLVEDNDVVRALCSLSTRQFDVVILRYICGYDTDRIAWYLGVSASTVDYHCRRAKERMGQVIPARIRKDK
ncbi:RNA polymerase sigma factor [Streptomyces sp. NPDC090306]|uniref:RNA polymerase sigma factor n=1 Tax=unclassified Streptomyces TaxID=2593676 RepID=UPI0036E5944B